MTISDITAILTGEHMMAKNTSNRAQPLPDQIARLAYELYEARGRGEGRDVHDWLSAEQQLTHGDRQAGN